MEKDPTKSLSEATQQVPILEFVERLKLDELGPEQRLDAIRHASPESFVFGLTAVHQVVAPEADISPADYAMKMTDPRAENPDKLLAEPEQRMAIFDTAYTLAEQLVGKFDQEGGDIENVLERVANLAAFSIVLAHPFENGNGRTARTIGQLIRFGASTDVNRQDLLLCATERPLGEDSFRIDSYMPKGSPEPINYLHELAAMNVPFDQAKYHQAAEFTTPYEQNISYYQSSTS